MEKFLVIGLDGADLDVLAPWLSSGELPTLAALAAEGVSGPLRSVLPPVSAPAWATFMTGRNPGRHGLFGFVAETPAGGTRLADYRFIRGEKLWDVFSAAGRRTSVMNVPITWPPPAVRGSFVSGMLTPPGRPFTNPPELQAGIEAVAPGYRTDIDRHLCADRPAFLAHLHEVTAARARALRHLMERDDPDLLVAVFTETDRIQHHFWRRDRREILGLFRRIDDALGEMLAALDPAETTVVVVSDHGFTGTDRRFYANRWLKSEGYLATRRAPGPTDDYRRRRFNFFMNEPEEAKRGESRGRRWLRRLGLAGDETIDWRRTRAYLYSSDTRGIHVNLAGRGPRGIVDAADYEALRDEIVGKLRALRFPETGEPVFDLVAKREEIYSGPYVADAPDILLKPERDRYRVVTRVQGKRFLRQHGRAGGYHREEGILIARGPGIRRGETAEGAALMDVMPTLLFAAGLPVPDAVDGRVLRSIFTDSFLAGREERRVPAAPDAPAPEPDALSDEEDRVLRRRLEDLGYV